MIKMFPIRVILLIGMGISYFVFAAVISGCSKKENVAAEEPDHAVYQERINQLVDDGLDFELGDSVNEIIKTLGQPKDIQVDKIKNVHYPDEIVDEIHRLYYDGLYVQIYKATEGNKELLQALSITSNKFKVKLGLNVGTTKTEIRRTLGNPSNDSDDMWSYVYTEGYPNTVQFYFENDAVTKIEWSYWID